MALALFLFATSSAVLFCFAEHLKFQRIEKDFDRNWEKIKRMGRRNIFEN